MTTSSGAFEYPPEFVERVKRAFPHDKVLHMRLNDHSLSVGRHLEEAPGLDPEWVIEALDSEQEGLDRLREEALRLIELRGILREWQRICRAHISAPHSA